MPKMQGEGHTHSQSGSDAMPNGSSSDIPKGVPGGSAKGFPGGFGKGSPGGFPGFPGAGLFMGATGGGCVESGPFKDVKLHIGPLGIMKANNTRCLKRSINPALANSGASKEVFQKILGSKNFGELRQNVEVPSFGGSGSVKFGADFHSLGHGGVGGEVQRPFHQ
jgi:hypothetical protein